jgi:hypothetical protein
MNSYPMTDSTTKILKNFAGISPSVTLKVGRSQRTVSGTRSVMAIAEFKDAWPQTTPVYALPELLANLSAYQSPTLTFEDTQFVIRGANTPSHVEYPYSDASVIPAVPEREFDVSNPHAVFVLPDTAVAEIKKFAAINSLPVVRLDVDGVTKSVTVKPYDDKNPASRSYSYPVPEKDILTLADDAKRTVMVRTEHLALLMDGGYTVTVGEWNYLFFTHQTEPISYFVAVMPPRN